MKPLALLLATLALVAWLRRERDAAAPYAAHVWVGDHGVATGGNVTNSPSWTSRDSDAGWTEAGWE